METEMKLSVSVFGIGLMGSKIAWRLATSGFTVTAWNRNYSKAEALQQFGVSARHSVQEAAQASDVLLLILADAQAIKDTILASSVLPLLAGKTVLQMGTIGVTESKEIAALVTSAGAQYVEAPVQGSHPEAAQGTLQVMVGCDSEPSSIRCWPVLQCLGGEPNYIGPVGTAAAVKLAVNQLLATMTVSFSTSLGIINHGGADVDKFMSILRKSALYAPQFDKKLSKMMSNIFGAANFTTKMLLKDVRLCTQEARHANVDSQMLQAVEAVTERAIEQGHGEEDYSAVFDAVVHPSTSHS